MATCPNHAAFRYTWPGRNEATICIDHAQQLQNVANAIGLHLQIIPLEYKVSDPLPESFPLCQQEVKP